MSSPSKSTAPAPPANNPAAGRKCALACSDSFTCNGVSPGSASSSNAAAPLTTAADMLVPLIAM